MQFLAEEITPPESAFAELAQRRRIDPSQEMSSLARWPEWLTLSFYCAIVAAAIPYHEPWADEAQAWQLARNVSLSDLFKTYIRYEGSPGLWHFFLWVLSRAHVSYAGMHWVCGAIAAIAASVLLFASPFPRYIKLALPFTYFLLFQYAVVARSYVLAPVLLFAIAYFWRRNSFIVAVALGLLANVALHAAVISGGLAVVYAIEHLRLECFKNASQRRKLLALALILAAFYAFAVWTAKPPHDIAFKTSPGPAVISALIRVIELCRPFGLAIPFWIAICLWFSSRRALIYLLPVALCSLFCMALYGSWWHVGLLYPLLICLLWITWPTQSNEASQGAKIGQGALIAMIAVQAVWSGYALWFDHYNAYSPDRAAAQFLRSYVKSGAKIAVTYAGANSANAFTSVGILPYFDNNIYANLRYPFWWWSNHDTNEQQFDNLLPSHPKLVIVEAVFRGAVDHVTLDAPRYKSITEAGYKYADAFCGTMPERLELRLTNCHVIFMYPDEQQNPVSSSTSGLPGR